MHGSTATPIEFRRAEIARRFSLAQGLLHVSNADETAGTDLAAPSSRDWRAHEIPLAVRNMVPIETTDYPTKAQRPLNCRLDLTHLNQQLGIQMPHWQDRLAKELAYLAIRNAAPSG
jgi:dTDP-4-dehydrorhamnose reductase